MTIDQPDLSNGAWDRPTMTCDLVMKGGITSGVVYPGAILHLAETYRFRSIGGASAGAIAAAVTAAAEFGRRQGTDGFARLRELALSIRSRISSSTAFSRDRSSAPRSS